MDLTAVVPAPSFIDRFRAAWRGEESLAWVFWSYYVLVGVAISLVLVAVLFVLQSISGGDSSQLLATPLGSAYAIAADLVELVYLGVAFILFVRCISNVNWRGWHYAGMLCLLGIAYLTVEQMRQVSAGLLGG